MRYTQTHTIEKLARKYEAIHPASSSLHAYNNVLPGLAWPHKVCNLHTLCIWPCMHASPVYIVYWLHHMHANKHTAMTSACYHFIVAPYTLIVEF